MNGRNKSIVSGILISVPMTPLYEKSKNTQKAPCEPSTRSFFIELLIQNVEVYSQHNLCFDFSISCDMFQ